MTSNENPQPKKVVAPDEREITVEEEYAAATEAPDALCLARGGEYIDGVLHLTGRCVFLAGHDNTGSHGGHSWEPQDA